jgi:hypothetical protein
VGHGTGPRSLKLDCIAGGGGGGGGEKEKARGERERKRKRRKRRGGGGGGGEEERFEVFKTVTMKNDVFWNVTPCGSCNNRRFG